MNSWSNIIGSVTLLSPSNLGSGSILLPRTHASESLVPLEPYPIPEHFYDPKTSAPKPPLPPPHLSPPAGPNDYSLSVTLQLGELLGEGGSSHVYAATVVSVTRDGGAGVEEPQILVDFPPLAVKMARRLRRGHLAREAWFYDEMHELQGSVIPRCYGWFDAPETSEFKGDTYSPSEDSERDHGFPDHYPSPWSEELQLTSVPRNRISILVIERLGKTLSQWGGITPDVKDDVLSLCDDTGYVDILDVRHCNILHVYEGPGALPSLPSPLTHRVHSWRLLDLEGCQKIHSDPRYLRQEWRSAAGRLMRQLDKGHIIEPWDY